jgi:hypothetical protein
VGLCQAMPGDGAGREQEEVNRFARSPNRVTGFCVLELMYKAPSGALSFATA